MPGKGEPDECCTAAQHCFAQNASEPGTQSAPEFSFAPWNSNTQNYCLVQKAALRLLGISMK